MQVISLEIIGFKKILAGSAIFKDGVTFITGDNGAGKSSFLDAILVALGACTVEKPVNKDSARSVVTLRLGDDNEGYDIERKFTDSGKYLDVRRSDGKKITSPQKFLDSLFASCIDPEAFLRMKKADACAQLRIACGINTDHLDQKSKELFDSRTIVNRELARHEATLQSLGDKVDAPEPLSASDLLSELDTRKSAVESFELLRNNGISLRDKRPALVASIEEAKKVLKQLEDDLVDLDCSMKDIRETCASNLQNYQSDKARIIEINKSLSAIDENNRIASDAKYKNAQIDEAMRLRNAKHAESYELTQKIEAIAAEKKEILELADYPVEGMYVEGDGIYVNDVPLSEVNTADRIRIAMHVAMNQNPKLKIVIIRNGSMLDEKSLKIVEEMATAKGYQVLIEKVGSHSGESIHITEGVISQ